LFLHIIDQLHHILEITLGIVAADVEERQQARVLARDAFEVLEALELALEGPRVLEGVSPDDLRRAQHASRTASRDPYFSIGALADPPEQFIIGNRRCARRACLSGGGGAGFQRSRFRSIARRLRWTGLVHRRPS